MSRRWIGRDELARDTITSKRGWFNPPPFLETRLISSTDQRPGLESVKLLRGGDCQRDRRAEVRVRREVLRQNRDAEGGLDKVAVRRNIAFGADPASAEHLRVGRDVVQGSVCS